MKKILFVLLVAAAVSSCRNLPNMDQLTYRPIVVTNHDANADFKTYQTYYLPSVIPSFGDDPLDTLLDPSLAVPILNAIKQNMNDRGYVQEMNSSLADLGFNIVILKVTNVETYYPGYWYDYGYGWYYPYYPYYPYSYTYSYSTGTMAIDLLDFKNVPAGDLRAKVLWTNVDNGVLGNTSSSALAVDAINQAYTQSAYIQAN